jgi:hypothetical protein
MKPVIPAVSNCLFRNVIHFTAKSDTISMAGCLIRSAEDRKIDEIVAYKNINQDRYVYIYIVSDLGLYNPYRLCYFEVYHLFCR